jgi:hypothetical protein
MCKLLICSFFAMLLIVPPGVRAQTEDVNQHPCGTLMADLVEAQKLRTETARFIHASRRVGVPQSSREDK